MNTLYSELESNKSFNSVNARKEVLIKVLDRYPAIAIAVSGGIDSMLLAWLANRYSTAKIVVFHAISAAVPQTSTARVRFYAELNGWALQCIDAGEMADPVYLSNPVDRCFYCKKNLYGSIGKLTSYPIASGTNLEDLQDYRPGLKAEEQYAVIHPYVDAGLCKQDIYELARTQGLDELAALSAQPCLSSRIETGIVVKETNLRFIEKVEGVLTKRLPGQASIRCRITVSGVFFECETVPEGEERDLIEKWGVRICQEFGHLFGGLRKYQRGSAFLLETLS